MVSEAYDSGWLWACASALVVALAGFLCKVFMVYLNSPTVLNRAALQRATLRPRGVPLLTVANHHSCFDDPGILSVLSDTFRRSRVRWTLAAHDVCFTDAVCSTVFALGKCVPVVRGAGVYQPAMDFCIERLSRGEWVHIFPEGRVNERKEHIRLKWGVGRLVAAARPLVLPVWRHEGMERVRPHDTGRLRVRQRVYINVGEPIQLDYLLERLKKSNASEEETRKAITDVIQDELLRLRDETHALVRRAAGKGCPGLLYTGE